MVLADRGRLLFGYSSHIFFIITLLFVEGIIKNPKLFVDQFGPLALIKPLLHKKLLNLIFYAQLHLDVLYLKNKQPYFLLY